MIPTLSGEQKIILKNIKKGKNIIVNAVAGSGKSTTVLSIAITNPDKNVLQLTYNSSLRTEIKEKVNVLNISNLKVHTYHSLSVRYYLSTAYTDTAIRYILYNKLEPTETIPLYDIIVIDEAQDLTIEYFHLVRKFIIDMINNTNHKIQLVILGDTMQGLYEFKGSDIRFLSLADKLWSGCLPNTALISKKFIHCSMKMSYRITNQICSFINHAMIGEPRLNSCKDGEHVKYIRNSRQNIEKIVVYEITQLLLQGSCPSDIFVLAGSVKGSNMNISAIENALVNKGIPCFVPMNENIDKLDDRVIDGKIVFSTFHTTKGRERRYVFIVGFDNGYFDFNARDLPRDICPNTLYVGATRAKERLYLLEFDQYSTDRPLPFLKLSHHDMIVQPYIHFKGIPRSIFYVKNNDNNNDLQNKHFITPTELIKFIPNYVIEEITKFIDIIFTNVNVFGDDTLIYNELDIPSFVETKTGCFEEIAQLNGIAIPSVYYDCLIGENSNLLYNILQDCLNEFKENQHLYLQQKIRELPEKSTLISEYLYMANLYITCQEKLYFKLKQIQTYNWITEDTMNKCRELLNNTIGKEIENIKPIIESTIITYTDNEQHNNIDMFLNKHFIGETFRFKARVDLITEHSLWELKCCSTISFDHLLQLVIYSWIWKMTHDENDTKQFKILNIKTGELKVLNANIEQLNTIMLCLLKGKYFKNTILTDDEFIKNCII